MFANLLGEMGIRDELNQIIDGVDGGVDGLKALDLLAYGQGVGHVGDVAPPVVGPHHGGGGGRGSQAAGVQRARQPGVDILEKKYVPVSMQDQQNLFKFKV
jgi:hypothetical protein